jgi:hypothetical protein
MPNEDIEDQIVPETPSHETPRHRSYEPQYCAKCRRQLTAGYAHESSRGVLLCDGCHRNLQGRRGRE